MNPTRIAAAAIVFGLGLTGLAPTADAAPLSKKCEKKSYAKKHPKKCRQVRPAEAPAETTTTTAAPVATVTRVSAPGTARDLLVIDIAAPGMPGEFPRRITLSGGQALATFFHGANNGLPAGTFRLGFDVGRGYGAHTVILLDGQPIRCWSAVQGPHAC